MALHSPPHVVEGQEHPANIGAHWRPGGHDRGSFVCEGDKMSGRPDYDVGDLVVCVVSENPDYGLTFVVEAIVAPHPPNWVNWGVVLAGNYSYHITKAWEAEEYRRIDPKPPEFWTGEVEANQRDKVPA